MKEDENSADVERKSIEEGLNILHGISQLYRDPEHKQAIAHFTENIIELLMKTMGTHDDLARLLFLSLFGNMERTYKIMTKWVDKQGLIGKKGMNLTHTDQVRHAFGILFKDDIVMDKRIRVDRDSTGTSSIELIVFQGRDHCLTIKEDDLTAVEQVILTFFDDDLFAKKHRREFGDLPPRPWGSWMLSKDVHGRQHLTDFRYASIVNKKGPFRTYVRKTMLAAYLMYNLVGIEMNYSRKEQQRQKKDMTGLFLRECNRVSQELEMDFQRDKWQAVQLCTSQFQRRIQQMQKHLKTTRQLVNVVDKIGYGQEVKRIEGGTTGTVPLITSGSGSKKGKGKASGAVVVRKDNAVGLHNLTADELRHEARRTEAKITKMHDEGVSHAYDVRRKMPSHEEVEEHRNAADVLGSSVSIVQAIVDNGEMPDLNAESDIVKERRIYTPTFHNDAGVDDGQYEVGNLHALSQVPNPFKDDGEGVEADDVFMAVVSTLATQFEQTAAEKKDRFSKLYQSDTRQNEDGSAPSRYATNVKSVPSRMPRHAQLGFVARHRGAIDPDLYDYLHPPKAK